MFPLKQHIVVSFSEIKVIRFTPVVLGVKVCLTFQEPLIDLAKVIIC